MLLGRYGYFKVETGFYLKNKVTCPQGGFSAAIIDKSGDLFSTRVIHIYPYSFIYITI